MERHSSPQESFIKIMLMQKMRKKQGCLSVITRTIRQNVSSMEKKSLNQCQSNWSIGEGWNRVIMECDTAIVIEAVTHKEGCNI